MMKRIVLFADVHGNITGLREVIKAAKKLENLEYIIGLGDYFGWGAGCNDVIELCRENDVILIRGGHEEILNLIDRKEDPGNYYPEIYFTHDWLKKNLNPEYYEYVTNLPLEIRLKLNDKYSLIGILINCASVGQRRKDNLSNYTIIEYDEEKIAVIQKQVPYDKAEEDRLVEERGMMRRL